MAEVLAFMDVIFLTVSALSLVYTAAHRGFERPDIWTVCASAAFSGAAAWTLHERHAPPPPILLLHGTLAVYFVRRAVSAAARTPHIHR